MLNAGAVEDKLEGGNHRLELRNLEGQFLGRELRSCKPHGTAKEGTDLKPRHIQFCAQTRGLAFIWNAQMGHKHKADVSGGGHG